MLDGGRGNDTYTGDLGLDEFFDASPSAINGVDDDGDGRVDEADEDEIDTLVENLGARIETHSADVGLYNDKLVIGNLLNSGGSAGFEVGKNAADRADRRRRPLGRGATVENLKNLFEEASIDGAGGNNTIVVNDLDRSIQVGDTRIAVINWRGTARLDNAANDGLFPEHYLVTVPFDSPALVHIRSSANDAFDRLVLTGTDSADRYLLLTARRQLRAQRASRPSRRCELSRPGPDTNLTPAMTVTHQGVENVEINSRGGDDRMAVRTIHTRTVFNTGAGNDSVYLGKQRRAGRSRPARHERRRHAQRDQRRR